LAVQAHRGRHLAVVHAGDDPRPHRLEAVRVLRAPHRAVAALPGALAHVVADRPAEHVVGRLVLRNLPALLADDGDELTLVLEYLARVLRLDDRVVVRAKRVVGAIADVRPLRELRLHASALGRLDDVIAVVDAYAEEGRWHGGDQELHGRKLVPG